MFSVRNPGVRIFNQVFGGNDDVVVRSHYDVTLSGKEFLMTEEEENLNCCICRTFDFLSHFELQTWQNRQHTEEERKI
jgi:hypothetical protein